MITLIRIIECSALQLSHAGLGEGDLAFQSSTCDSDFATYDFSVALQLEEATNKIPGETGGRSS